MLTGLPCTVSCGESATVCPISGTTAALRRRAGQNARSWQRLRAAMRNEARLARQQNTEHGSFQALLIVNVDPVPPEPRRSGGYGADGGHGVSTCLPPAGGYACSYGAERWARITHSLRPSWADAALQPSRSPPVELQDQKLPQSQKLFRVTTADRRPPRPTARADPQPERPPAPDEAAPPPVLRACKPAVSRQRANATPPCRGRLPIRPRHTVRSRRTGRGETAGSGQYESRR